MIRILSPTLSVLFASTSFLFLTITVATAQRTGNSNVRYMAADWVATCSVERGVVLLAEDGHVVLHTATDSLIWLTRGLPIAQRPFHLAADSRSIAVVDNQGRVFFYRYDGLPTLVSEFAVDSSATSIAVLDDDVYLATPSFVIRRSASAGSIRDTRPVEITPAFAQGNDVIVEYNYQPYLVIHEYDVNDGTTSDTLDVSDLFSRLLRCAVSVDGSWLAVVGLSRTGLLQTVVMSLPDGTLRCQLPLEAQYLRLAISNSGKVSMTFGDTVLLADHSCRWQRFVYYRPDVVYNSVAPSNVAFLAPHQAIAYGAKGLIGTLDSTAAVIQARNVFPLLERDRTPWRVSDNELLLAVSHSTSFDYYQYQRPTSFVRSRGVCDVPHVVIGAVPFDSGNIGVLSDWNDNLIYDPVLNKLQCRRLPGSPVEAVKLSDGCYVGYTFESNELVRFCDDFANYEVLARPALDQHFELVQGVTGVGDTVYIFGYIRYDDAPEGHDRRAVQVLRYVNGQLERTAMRTDLHGLYVFPPLRPRTSARIFANVGDGVNEEGHVFTPATFDLNTGAYSKIALPFDDLYYCQDHEGLVICHQDINTAVLFPMGNPENVIRFFVSPFANTYTSPFVVVNDSTMVVGISVIATASEVHIPAELRRAATTSIAQHQPSAPQVHISVVPTPALRSAVLTVRGLLDASVITTRIIGTAGNTYTVPSVVSYNDDIARVDIDCTAIPSGVYTVMVAGGASFATAPLVVLR